jgi:hypothetical protein
MMTWRISADVGFTGSVGVFNPAREHECACAGGS